MVSRLDLAILLHHSYLVLLNTVPHITELIPQSKREMFHLLIGTKILINTPSEQLEDSIFDIVSQVRQLTLLYFDVMFWALPPTIQHISFSDDGRERISPK